MSETFNPGSDFGMADWARQVVTWGHRLPDAFTPQGAGRITAIFQSRCLLPRCDWASGCLNDREEVGKQLEHHLERHAAALAWARGGERQS